MANERFILLSFDVEEFDLPLEYGNKISTELQLQTAFEGLEKIDVILNDLTIETTLFTTAFFAQHYSAVIKKHSLKHEIASHTFYHNSYETADLLKSKIALEAIVQQEIYGLRMPRMQQVNIADILAAGYQYDSSLNPTYIPGRYNHFSKPRTVFHEDGLVKIPSSVSPNLRIPLFWLCFKNAPEYVYRQLLMHTLKHDGYINLYFHPWEFAAISQFDKIPGYIKNNCGNKLLDKLLRLIKYLRNEGEFVSIHRFLNQSSEIASLNRS